MNIENVWDEYQVSLKRFIQSKVSEPADVDDLLNDIFIKTMSSIHTLEASKSFKSWLFQIANYAIIDYYRKKVLPTDLSIKSLSSIEESPSLHEELAGCILPFINTLPKKEAALLLAIDINQESQKDYAKKHNLNYSTLKSRVQKSRLKLKKQFENCCTFSIGKNKKLLNYTQKSSHFQRC